MVRTVSSFFVPLAIIVISYWAIFRLHKLSAQKGSDNETKESPLEIIFDQSNPARRFWSMESMKSETGTVIPYWEYRADIKNKSDKTIRNVSVTTEHIGLVPQRPADQVFDKIRKTTCDIKPRCSELVPVLRWPIPGNLPGTLAGSSALEYGPIKITASADDVLPTVRIFQFDYQEEPMLFNEKEKDHLEGQLQKQDIIPTAVESTESFFDVVPITDNVRKRLKGLFVDCYGERGKDSYEVRLGSSIGEQFSIVLVDKKSDKDVALDVSYIRKGTECGYDLLYNRLYNGGLRAIENSENYQRKRGRQVRTVMCLISSDEEVVSVVVRHRDRLERELKAKKSTVEIVMLSEQKTLQKDVFDLWNVENCNTFESIFKLER